MSDVVEVAQSGEAEPEEDAEEELDPEPAEDTRVPTWTSDAALTLDEARDISSRRGASVVMLLGEVGTGKSTVLVELWTELLVRGKLAGIAFGGSANSLAFESRSFESRLESGEPRADTRRTQEEDDGFLHLRVRRSDNRIVELLFADFTGEHFRAVREGTPLIDELPWTARVDRFLVIVDGRGLSEPALNEVTLTRTRRLLLALRESGQAASSSRVAILLTKEDAMTEQMRSDCTAIEDGLVTRARDIDPDAVALRVAARPDNMAEPWGMAELLEWICQDDKPGAAVSLPIERPLRAMGRFRQ